MAQIRTKTRDTVLVDELRESPVDRDLSRTGRILFLVVALIVAALFIVPRLRADAPSTNVNTTDTAFVAVESRG